MQFEELDMAEHACNLNLLEVEARVREFKVTLSSKFKARGMHLRHKQTNKYTNVNHGAVKLKQVLAAKHGKLSSILEPMQREKEKTDST